MTLVKWHPWREVNTLQRQLDRFFDDEFWTTPWRDFNRLATVPAAEISEDDQAIYLKLEIPGLEAKDLDIQVTDRAVSVSGERKSENTSETRSEFYYGKFQRVIPLSAQVENTNVKAEYKNGIVSLTLPKTTVEKNKVVKVEIN